jgi:hypothetical protein
VLKKFHLLFLLIDVNSFSLPDINFIPGIHHFGNFLEIVAKGFKPLYVVSAEQKRQQNREYNRQYREKMRDKVKMSKQIY